eukprot:scaffold105895_cov36-Phaeocystis_antarctica.AAC.1
MAAPKKRAAVGPIAPTLSLGRVRRFPRRRTGLAWAHSARAQSPRSGRCPIWHQIPARAASAGEGAERPQALASSMCTRVRASLAVRDPRTRRRLRSATRGPGPSQGCSRLWAVEDAEVSEPAPPAAASAAAGRAPAAE